MLSRLDLMDQVGLFVWRGRHGGIYAFCEICVAMLSSLIWALSLVIKPLQKRSGVNYRSLWYILNVTQLFLTCRYILDS